MRIPVRSLAALFAGLLLSSCVSTYTMPTAEDMDRYYKKAEELAQKRIETLEGQRERGEITSEEFELQKARTLEKIPDQASQLAWARHESIEAQKRALGIPTGDHPVQIDVPSTGSGESFYRRAGTSGADYYTNTPTGGTIFGGPNRGRRASPPPPEEPQQPRPAPEPEEEAVVQ